MKQELQTSSQGTAPSAKRPANKSLIVLAAAVILIVAVTAAGIFVNRGMQTFYSLDDSIAGILLADKIGGSELEYTAEPAEDGSPYYRISFPQLGEYTAIRFDDALIKQQDSRTFTADYKDLLAFIDDNYDLVQGSTAQLTFPYTATSGSGTTRREALVIGFPMLLPESVAAPALDEQVTGGDRVTGISFPAALERCIVRFMDSAVQPATGNSFTFNQDDYLLASAPAEADTVTASLPYTVSLQDSVIFEGTLPLEFSSVPYFSEESLIPVISRQGISDNYDITLNTEDNLTAAISDPLFEQASGGQYKLNRLAAIGKYGPTPEQAASSETPLPESIAVPYTVVYTYGTHEVFSKPYTLDIDMRTPLSVNAYKAECRTGSETISGVVAAGSVVKLGGKKLDLKDNGDGTMSFEKTVTVKEGKTYKASLEASREGELVNTQEINIKGLKPVDYSLPTSIQEGLVTLNFVTDPEFSISMQISFYPYYSDSEEFKEKKLFDSKTAPIKVAEDGTAQFVFNFSEGYGLYNFTIKCYDKNGKQLYTKSKEVFHETKEMKEEREYKHSCKYIDFYTYWYSPYDYVEKNVCFEARVDRFITGGFFIMDDGYSYYEILVDGQSDAVVAFLKSHIGDWVTVYGRGDASPEYTGYYYYYEFNLKYADYGP